MAGNDRSGGIRQRSIFALMAFAVGVAALGDFFFYRHAVGWTAGAFGLAVLGGLRWRFGRRLAGRPAFALQAGLAGLCLSLTIEPNLPVTVLALGFAVGLALLARLGWTANAEVWFVRLMEFAVKGWRVVFGDWRRCWRAMRRRRVGMAGGTGQADTSDAFGRIKGWIVPILLSFVFVMLFAIANPVLTRLLTHFGETLRGLRGVLVDWISPVRLLFWLLLAGSMWTLLRGRIQPREARATLRELSNANRDRLLSTGFAIRCLFLFNVVFAGQTAMDVFYLIGGAKLPEGLTYAEYAHRGAYPLIATALLAAVFVLATFRPTGPAESSGQARRLVYLWLAQNVFLTFTAIWRLHLYVEIYTLTRLRVAAGIWMALVAGGLGLICWRILRRRSNRWLIDASVLMTLAVLYVSAFVPFNTIIADYNVAHCRELKGEGPALDLEYMRRLKLGALPGLARYVREGSAPPSQRLAAMRLIERRCETLKEQTADWRGWTLMRMRWGREVQAPMPMAERQPASSR